MAVNCDKDIWGLSAFSSPSSIDSTESDVEHQYEANFRPVKPNPELNVLPWMEQTDNIAFRQGLLPPSNIVTSFGTDSKDRIHLRTLLPPLDDDIPCLYARLKSQQPLIRIGINPDNMGKKKNSGYLGKVHAINPEKTRWEVVCYRPQDVPMKRRKSFGGRDRKSPKSRQPKHSVSTSEVVTETKEDLVDQWNIGDPEESVYVSPDEPVGQPSQSEKPSKSTPAEKDILGVIEFAEPLSKDLRADIPPFTFTFNKPITPLTNETGSDHISAKFNTFVNPWLSGQMSSTGRTVLHIDSSTGNDLTPSFVSQFDYPLNLFILFSIISAASYPRLLELA